MNAKRLALEKAGIYIESRSEIRNFKLSKDEIKTFSAAILKTEIVKEEIRFESESIVIYMIIKVDVNTEDVIRKIRKIKSDNNLQLKTSNQQKKLNQLEYKLTQLQNQLASKNFEQSLELRKERAEVFNSIDELSKIRHNILNITNKAIENIEIGMLSNEVEKVVGKPRSVKKHYNYPTSDIVYYNYGKIWVIFEGGAVSCIIKSEFFNLGHDCSFHRNYKSIGVIK